MVPSQNLQFFKVKKSNISNFYKQILNVILNKSNATPIEKQPLRVKKSYSEIQYCQKSYEFEYLLLNRIVILPSAVISGHYLNIKS